MAVNYKKLWKLLLDKGINKTELVKLTGLSTDVIANIGKNEYVSLKSLEKICLALNYNIEDIVEFNKNGGD